MPRLDFSTESVAIGLLEIYDVPKGGAVTVDLDIVQTPEGTPLANAETKSAREAEDCASPTAASASPACRRATT